MGANKSKQSIESLTKVTTEVLNKTINKVENSAEANVQQYQNMTVDFSNAVIENCMITVEQDSVAKAQVMVNATTTLATEMTTELTTAIEKELENSLEQTNSGLNFGSINTSDAKIKTMSEITNKVTNIVENSIKNIVKVSSTNAQNMEFLARGLRMSNCPRGGLKISQKALSDVVAETIATNIVETIMDTAVITDIKETAKNSAKQTNAGLVAISSAFCLIILLVVGGIFAFTQTGKVIPTPVKIGIVACIVLCICVSIGYIIYTLTKKDEGEESFGDICNLEHQARQLDDSEDEVSEYPDNNAAVKVIPESNVEDYMPPFLQTYAPL